MGRHVSVHRKLGAGQNAAAVDAVRQAIQSESDVAALSPEESALLVSQLTTLLARVERLRALGPVYAGIGVSRDVQELLARLEVGSSMSSGVH